MGECSISALENYPAVSTKEKIFEVAVRLFSDRGYDGVSMRDIARATGITVASIYNHYPSKKDILSSTYRFYEQQNRAAAPTQERLRQLAETTSVAEALAGITYYHDPSIQEIMDRILVIASRQISMDAESEAFVRENLFTLPAGILTSMLNRLVELGKIEPLNVHAFICLFKYYAYGAAVLNSSPLQIRLEDWNAGMELLFSLIRPK